jgi:hypothetical protein
LIGYVTYNACRNDSQQKKGQQQTNFQRIPAIQQFIHRDGPPYILATPELVKKL